MRTIKFRALDKKNKKMDTVWSIEFAGKDANNITANEVSTNGLLLGVDTQAILMQFTGLLDKNGVEIYEGDIVQFRDDFVDDEPIVTEAVEYKNGAFQVQGAKSLWILGEMITTFEVEVIGNIYQTKLKR